MNEKNEPYISIEINKETMSLSVPDWAVPIIWAVIVLLPVGACVLMHFLLGR